MILMKVSCLFVKKKFLSGSIVGSAQGLLNPAGPRGLYVVPMSNPGQQLAKQVPYLLCCLLVPKVCCLDSKIKSFL